MASTRIFEFDTWRPGYGNASVSILVGGTTTLASVFLDQALTQPASNPQILIQKTDQAGVSYGKFQAPVYVAVPYQLQINSIDTTGVQQVPLTTLQGQDASLATVIPTGGSVASNIKDLFARRVDVRDYGQFLAVGAPGASASTNNATLVLAIGAAAALGGAYVDLPGGTYQVTTFTVPQGVVVRGTARDATVIQSNFAGNVATIAGVRGGFQRLTLDGISLVHLSVGIYAASVNEIILDDVVVKRFETGILRKGGSLCVWRDLTISNCVSGYLAHGDSALGAGGPLTFNIWIGGEVNTCTTVGVDYANIDQVCQQNIIEEVTFDTNTGTAVNVVGARGLSFRGCQWTGNTTNLVVNDGAAATSTNTVVGLEFDDGAMVGGALTFSGTYQGVEFRRMVMAGVSPTVNASAQNIVLEDCQPSNITVAGVASAWLYRQTKDSASSFILTTGSGAAGTWALTLKPGQQVYLEARVIGRQRNGGNIGYFHFSQSANNPGSLLPYGTQTAGFTLGHILTGQTSGATGRVVADSGTQLTLYDVAGVFLANEIIKDDAGGSAAVTAPLSPQNASLSGSINNIRAPQRTDANWTAIFAILGQQVIVQVAANDTNQTIEWTTEVKVTTDQGTPIAVATGGFSTMTFTNFQGGSVVNPQFSVGQTIYQLAGSFLVFPSGLSPIGLASITAQATIVNVIPSGVMANGATGTLVLSGVSGTFTNGSYITTDGNVNSPPIAPYANVNTFHA